LIYNYILLVNMISEGYNNHASPVMELSDYFPDVNQRGAPTWDVCNLNFSGDIQQQVGQPFMKKNFYEDEYRKMVLEMDKEELPQDEKKVDPFEELLQLSVLADEGFHSNEFELPPVTPIWNKHRPSRLSINSFLRWKRYQDEKHELVMAVIKKLEQNDIEQFRSRQLHWKNSIVNVIRARFGNVVTGECNFQKCATIKSNIKREEKIKRYLSGVCQNNGQDQDDENFVCRHFAEGYSRRGDNCDFQHDIMNSHPDTQKVFLGGLPRSITSHKLVWELKKKGYTVVNKPKVVRRYSPQVCLGSVKEAELMLQKGTIIIDGCTVNVRPYKAFMQKETDRQRDIDKRSVFLEGLTSAMTVRIIKTEMEKLGYKVTIRPLINAGFIPKITLATVKQANQLIAQGVIELNGVAVNVRPYMLSKNQTIQV